MRALPSLGPPFRRVLAPALAVVTLSSAAAAAPSELRPEVGWNQGLTESPRIGAVGGALRAFSSSTDALFINPANMAAARVYHIGALGQIWPEASRQSYGLAIVDSIVSASRLAGGLSGVWTRQDPDGLDRTALDVRFALAFPFSESFFLGGSARYLSLTQDGAPRGVYDLPPSDAARGLRGEPIVKAITFDAGATVKPTKELAFALVGQNLTDPGNGLLPLLLGGGIAYGTREFTLEADVSGDFTTWDRDTLRAMGGGEFLAASRVPLRAGYRYDQGAASHTVSGGIGYVDRQYSLDLTIGRAVVGEGATTILLGFKYHVESGGLGDDTDL